MLGEPSGRRVRSDREGLDPGMTIIRFPRFDPFEVTISILGAAFFVGLSLAFYTRRWPRSGPAQLIPDHA